MGITHLCFGLSYLTALGLELARQAWPRRWLRLLSLAFGFAGLTAQTIFLIAQQPSPASAYGSLLVLSWVFAVFYLYGAIHHWLQTWSLFVLPLVVALVAVSFVFRGDAATLGTWTAPEHFWGVVHGLLVLAASIGITVGFLASIMYLVQARRLRMKRNPLGSLRLLSLERLEAMNRRAINLAFPLLTVGLLLGFLRWPSASDLMSGWKEAKILGTVGLWLVALVLLYLRYGVHVPPRRLAVLTMAAFALMLVTLVAGHPFASAEVGR